MNRCVARALGAALALTLAAPAPAFQATAILEGVARAKDGDGLMFGEVEVRLQGIAAPEWNGARRDPGGEASLRALAALADGRTVRCDLDGTTARGRPVGVCHVDGADLGAAMVRAGHARDCPRYSGGRYRAAERQARAAGRDLSATYPLPGYC